MNRKNWLANKPRPKVNYITMKGTYAVAPEITVPPLDTPRPRSVYEIGTFPWRTNEIFNQLMTYDPAFRRGVQEVYEEFINSRENNE